METTICIYNKKNFWLKEVMSGKFLFMFPMRYRIKKSQISFTSLSLDFWTWTDTCPSFSLSLQTSRILSGVDDPTFFRSPFYWEDKWTAIFMLNSTERNYWYWISSVQCSLLNCLIWMKSGQGEAWLVSAWWCGGCATFCVIWPAHTHLTGVCSPEQGRNKAMKMDCLVAFF